jgi:hypothetical protein
MSLSPKFISSAVALFIALTGAGEAAADDADAEDPAAAAPATAPADKLLGIEIAARSGVGLPSVAPPAFGLGLRAGLSFGSVYFGATLSNHFAGGTYTAGSWGSASGGVSPPPQIQTEQRLLYGIQLGYDFEPRTWLTIRPGIGLGAASVSSSGTCWQNNGQNSCSATDPYVEGGAAVLFALGAHLFVGADAGFAWVPGRIYATTPAPGDGFVLDVLNAQLGVRC